MFSGNKNDFRYSQTNFGGRLNSESNTYSFYYECKVFSDNLFKWSKGTTDIGVHSGYYAGYK